MCKQPDWKGCGQMADNNASSSGNGQQQQADVMKRTIKDSSGEQTGDFSRGNLHGQ